MSLLNGSLSLSRYQVLETPESAQEDFIKERLKANGFTAIDSTTDKESIGWVEPLDMLSSDFAPRTFNFGSFYCFSLRIDKRQVSPQTVKRYLTITKADLAMNDQEETSGRQDRELKARIEQRLLGQTPLTTKLVEVCWFIKDQEIWLAATGTKIREIFESKWKKTFGLALRMKAPYILASSQFSKGAESVELNRLTPSAIFGQAASHHESD